MDDDTPESPFITVTPCVAIDWDQCLALLEDSELTEEQKVEFIETLWSIVLAFVDLGFGLHPMQQACGQDASLDDLNAIDVVALLEVSAGEGLQHTPAVTEDGEEGISA